MPVIGMFGQRPVPNLTSGSAANLLESKAETEENKWTRDSILTAIEYYALAADGWTLRQDNARSASCLRKKGRLLRLIGEKNQALKVFKKALNLVEGKEDTEKAMIFSELALQAIAAGDKLASDRYIAVINRLNESTLSPAAEASKFFAIAENAYYKRDIKTAVESYQKSAEIWRSQQNVKEEANCLLYLAFASLTLTNYSQGLIWSQEALTGFRSVGDRRGMAFSNIALGHILTTTDDNQAALNAYKEAESLFPADMDRVEKARLNNGIGNVYEVYGRWEISLEYRKKALSLYESDEHAFGELDTLPLIAKLNYLLGNDSVALDFFGRAQTLALNLGDELSQAGITEELADYYFFAKDYDKAKPYYLRFLKSADRVGLKNQKGRALVKLGFIYDVEQNPEESTDAYLQSIALSQELLNPMTESDALFNLSNLTWKLGNLDDALRFARNSVELTDSQCYKVANSHLKTSYFSNSYDRYHLYINLLMQMDEQNHRSNYHLEALRVAERAQARSMLENLALSEANFTADADPGTVTKEKEIRISLNSKADQLTNLLSRNADRGETSKLDSEITDLQHQLEQIRAELKQKSPIYSAIKDPAPFDVGEFQARVLDDNSLLLEFSLGKEESYLWVVGKSTFDSYVLPPREQIESRIERLRSLLNQGSMLPNEAVDVFQKRVADAEAEYLHEARILSNELLGQAADKLAGKRLIVVADGKIHYFPLAALPFPNSATDDPILLTNEVVYEPSAAALMLIKKMSASGKMPEKDLFLVSDPVYSKLDDRLDQNGSANSGFVDTVLGNFRSFDSLESLPRLPSSLEEAKSITEVVGSAGTTGHTGFAANRENILNAGIGDYKVIHFATHGLLDEKRPELSGIALSLFDDAGNRQDGGFIRLQDVYGMNLNADLVVLSACDTGLGKEIKGEGLMSLNNAFLQAGAKSVVSSLWRVDDTVTKILMTDFYSGMASENLTSSQALRQAQIKLRKDPRFSSPFYWASFTAQGNFNTAPQLSRSYNAWIFAAGLGLMSLCGIYWLRRSRNRKAG